MNYFESEQVRNFWLITASIFTFKNAFQNAEATEWINK